MPQENNYESQLDELRTREAEIRQRLGQIAADRTTNMNDVANLYGVNAADVDLGPNQEREKLQEELNEVIRKQSEIFEARRQDKIAEDKQKREERQTEINRNGKLQQAYKFFTYLDTATTQGYDLNGLTEDEILNLYDDFMTKPKYEQIKKETLDRAMKNDREIVIPTLTQTTVSPVEDYQTQIQQLRTKADEIRQKLAEISEARTTNINEMASVYGVNAADVDLGTSNTRNNLQSELDKILDQIALLEGAKGIDYANKRKNENAEKREEMSKKDLLAQAYKFFTYLDTTTTQGYDLNGLTEDEILNLYDDFMTKPEYEQIKKETLERAMKNDREVVIPLLKQTENQKGNNSIFGNDTYKQIKNNINLSDVAPMMSAADKKDEEPLYSNNNQSPDGVEDTPLGKIPSGAVDTTTSEPRPSLLNRAREWIQNNRGRTAMIVGAVVAVGAATAAAIHYIMTGDSQAAQNATAVDLNSLTNQAIAAVDNKVVDIAKQASDLAQSADATSIKDMLSETIKQTSESNFKLATNAYDAIAGNMVQIDPSVKVGIPVSAFDIANNVQVPLDALNNMTPEQMQNISVLMGDNDLAEMLKGVTDPNQMNNIISSNISHAQGYTQIPSQVFDQLSQGGRVL